MNRVRYTLCFVEHGVFAYEKLYRLGRTANSSFPPHIVNLQQTSLPPCPFFYYYSRPSNIEAAPAFLDNLRPKKSFNITFVSIRLKIDYCTLILGTHH
jgi:hypothetical protein